MTELQQSRPYKVVIRLNAEELKRFKSRFHEVKASRQDFLRGVLIAGCEEISLQPSEAELYETVCSVGQSLWRLSDRYLKSGKTIPKELKLAVEQNQWQQRLLMRWMLRT